MESNALKGGDGLGKETKSIGKGLGYIGWDTASGHWILMSFTN